jgi:AraC family transcriptional regulator of adaptative response / DNA-3-methyladenine glycosylase II
MRRAEASLTLEYRPPLDWAALLAFLRARATPGVESVAGETYIRTVALGRRRGWIAIRHDERREVLCAEVSLTLSLAPILPSLVARLRRLFDLDAHPAAVGAHLAGDPLLRPLVLRRPGLRVPGAFEGFEIGVRAILGQQVSVAAATTLAGRLAASFGDPITTTHPGLDRAFPAVARLARAHVDELRAIGLTGARAASLSALARAALAGEVRFDRTREALAAGDAREDGEPAAAMAALERLPGIGPWTSAYVGMRALGVGDAFPSSDLVLRRALGGVSAGEVLARAERWRPWRAYAAMHLWTSLAGDPS